MASTNETRSRSFSLSIGICFFLSGMCGLVYQVLWVRMLGLVFGHTTYAVSTVITAFMAGLALGSFYFGKWADRGVRLPGRGVISPLLLYGLLEGVVGLYCLFTPALFKGIEHLYVVFSGYPIVFQRSLCFVLSMAALIIPTFCMGGTLPLLSRTLIRSYGELGSRLGLLYFVNTAGAVTGTILSGFYLIANFGITATLQSAAVINLGIAVLVYYLDREMKKLPAAQEEDRAAAPGGAETATPEASETALPVPLEEGRERRLSLFIVSVFALTGFASMVYELAWTRSLSLSLGSSTYAFSTMLASFLAGIALGSIIYSVLSRRFAFPASSFGWLEIVLGASCVLIIPLLGVMPLLFIRIYPIAKGSYSMVVALDFLLCFAVMLLPTTLMGFIFPLVGKLATRSMEFLGKSIGSIYAVNTLGCIAGSFLTGFVLIPVIGVQNSLRIGVLLNVVGGLAILFMVKGRRGARTLCLFIAVLVVVLSGLLPPWNPAVMSSGSAIYAEVYQAMLPDFKKVARENVEFYRDGISATVAVYRNAEGHDLRINGKVDASTGGDMPTQLLSGYLPALSLKSPRNVFILGLGSGITVKAVLDFPEIESVECAELEPAVIEAQKFFAPYNGNILSDPRLKMLPNDGRNALLCSKKLYDIIISEPSNPWISGVSSLFTREFYQVCRSRLKKEGIICIWVHIYSMEPSNVKMILRTFFSVFPEGSLWFGAAGDLLIMGSPSPISMDYSRIRAAYEQNSSFRDALRKIGITAPDSIFSHYLALSAEIRPLAETAMLNTDNYPLLEFSAPVSLFTHKELMITRALYEFKAHSVPPGTVNAEKTLSGNFYSDSYELYRRMMIPLSARVLREGLALYPGDERLNAHHVRRLIEARQVMKAQELLKTLTMGDHGPAEYYLIYGGLLEEQNCFDRAEEMYRAAWSLDKTNEETLKKYILVMMEQKKYDEALDLLQGATGVSSSNRDLAFLKAQLLIQKGMLPEARGILERQREMDPSNPVILRSLLAIAGAENDYPSTITLARLILSTEPSDEGAILDLSKAYSLTGRRDEARKILMGGLARLPLSRRLVEALAALEAAKQ
ncbi:MAG: fused MFS/spermidine synthase [Candidatus Eremiobacteraeota bacterium]|nr:fused MFS/spermidine synthase [Candidatus Eremiobacteraeota bacterium]